MTLNLHALKRYEHWLNERCSIAEIAVYHGLLLHEQLSLAEQWTTSDDFKTDRKREEDWSKG